MQKSVTELPKSVQIGVISVKKFALKMIKSIFQMLKGKFSG